MIQRPTAHINNLVDALPEAVRQTLAELASAGLVDIETTIGLLPLGRRAFLEMIGVTKIETRCAGVARPQITLTPWGFEVLQACAAYESHHQDEEQEEERAQRLRRQLSAIPPTHLS